MVKIQTLSLSKWTRWEVLGHHREKIFDQARNDAAINTILNSTAFIKNSLLYVLLLLYNSFNRRCEASTVPLSEMRDKDNIICSHKMVLVVIHISRNMKDRVGSYTHSILPTVA